MSPWTIESDGSVTHEVLDSDGDLVSDDMLAAAGRTPAAEGRLLTHEV